MDKEEFKLLAFAAKAAGIELCVYSNSARLWRFDGDGTVPWNPLADNDDALKLAVRLGIGVLPKSEGVRTATAVCWEAFGWHVFDEEPDDPCAAARQAIVKAAAKVGEGLMTMDEFIEMFPGRFPEE